MNSDNLPPLRQSKSRRLGEQVLRYLLEHPEAQDTVGGIAEWWLLERRVADAVMNVEAALDDLVAREFLVATERKDGSVHYRLNRAMEREIRGHLRNARAAKGLNSPNT
jgi:hypothetical protein